METRAIVFVRMLYRDVDALDRREGAVTETYTVTYEITPTAVSDAIRLHQTTLLARYRGVMVLIAVAGIALAVAVDPTLGFTLTLFGILLLAMTWMSFIDRWLNRNRGRGVIGGTCKIELDDQGIHYEHPLGSGVVAWSALTHIRANDKSIVFGRDRVMAAYIPTSAFASPAERDSFLAFARARVCAPAATA